MPTRKRNRDIADINIDIKFFYESFKRSSEQWVLAGGRFFIVFVRVQT